MSDDHEIAGTTTFSQETVAVSNKMIKPQEKSQLYPVRDQSISDFLNKPHLVTTGNWNTSAVQNIILHQFDIGDTLRTSAFTNSVWSEKLKGFNFIRATAVVRVQLNATPFHSGKLICSLTPCYKDNSSTTFNNDWRQNTLCSVTQMPNVILDCRDGSAVFEVPYISPVDYFTLQTPDSIDWGRMFLKVMSPLGIGASGEVEIPYNIYLHFEDVELAAPLHPQAGGPVAVSRTSKSSKSAAPVAAPRSSSNSKSKVARGGRNVPRVVSEEENEAIQSTGIISKGLAMVGDIAEACNSVPYLAPFATPCSWIARGASQVASWFGWSKPAIESPVTYVSRVNEPNMATATGVSSALPLSILHDNKIQVKPGFGGADLDEMNFDYLKSIEAYTGSFDWTVDNNTEDILFQAPVQAISGEDYLSGAEYYTYYPPFSYLANYFTQYRGSIELTFRFVKTDFHTGRVSIYFVPATGLSTPSTVQSAYLLREIVDLRAQSEIKLTLPYLHYSKFIDTSVPLGTIYVKVVNELRAPETCSGTVSVLMFRNAGADFELAVPGSYGNATTDSIPFLPQMGGVEPEENQMLVSESIGNYPRLPRTMEAAAYSVGEVFTSLKQILLKYSILKSTAAIPNTNGTVSVYPYTIQLPSNNGVTMLSSDALCNFASGYLFMRGSINLGIASKGANTIKPVAHNYVAKSITLGVLDHPDMSLVDLIQDTPGTALSKDTSLVPVQEVDNGLGIYTYRLPYYCLTHSTLVKQQFFGGVPNDQWDPFSYLVVETGASNPSTATFRFYRSVAEDFHLGYFLGFPPMRHSDI